MADVFSHLNGHAGVIQANHRTARRNAQLHQRIDASADIEDSFELRLLVKKLLGRSPHYCVIGGSRARNPRLNQHARQCRPQAIQPGFGFGVGTAKSDVHHAGESTRIVI